MTVTAILDLQAKPEALSTLRHLLSSTVPATRAFRGNRGASAYQDALDPCHVVVIELWDSLEANSAYRAWRGGEGAVEALPELLVSAPRLAVLDEALGA